MSESGITTAPTATPTSSFRSSGTPTSQGRTSTDRKSCTNFSQHPAKFEVQPSDCEESQYCSAHSLEHHLPRAAEQLCLPVLLVLLVGGLERTAFYAVSTPWQNYMQNEATSRSPPGALGLGQSTATAIGNAYMVFASLTPVPFAIVADVKLGRYCTLVISLSMIAAGCTVQLITSLPGLVSVSGPAGLTISMVLIAFGTGGARSTLPPFLAEQFPVRESCIVQNTDGSKRVIDSRLTLQLVYNVYYAIINFACLSIIPATILEKQCGFWAPFAFATGSSCLATVLLLGTSCHLVKTVPGDNILVPAARVLTCAVRSGFKLSRAKSAVQLSEYGKATTYTDSFVDEVSATLYTCRILLSFAVFYLCANQMNNNLVSQAGQMRLSGIPNDMISVFASIACVLLAPMLQAFWSFLAHRNIYPSAITLIEVSFVLCAVAIAMASVTQRLIYTSPPCYDRPRTCDPGGRPNDISVWVQIPTYILAALAETIGFVTASGYAYSHSPTNAKSMIQAFSQLAAALGSLLGLATSPAARDPWLVTYYGALAGSMLLAAIIFWWFFKDDKEEANLPLSERQVQ